MMQFKSCIRCWRVGTEEEEIWVDGVEMKEIFLESVPLLPWLNEELSEDDELLRLIGEAVD